jgi:hypothetical protein
VADRDPDRIALDLDRELPARAGRAPRRHVGTLPRGTRRVGIPLGGATPCACVYARNARSGCSFGCVWSERHGAQTAWLGLKPNRREPARTFKPSLQAGGHRFDPVTLHARRPR